MFKIDDKVLVCVNKTFDIWEKEPKIVKYCNHGFAVLENSDRSIYGAMALDRCKPYVELFPKQWVEKWVEKTGAKIVYNNCTQQTTIQLPKGFYILISGQMVTTISAYGQLSSGTWEVIKGKLQNVLQEYKPNIE